MGNFRYQDPEFYTIIFDESLKGHFEVSSVRTNKDDIRKSVPGDPKLYVLQGKIVIVCSVNCRVYFLLVIKFLLSV